MDFLDIENYENLYNIHKLNKQIHLLNLEINEFENKKKSNLYFLKIQKDIFNNILLKKINLLKKYNFKIIKNILKMYYLKNKIKELNNYNILNNNLILNYLHTLKYYNIDKFNNKKSINKILLKLNNCLDSFYIKNLDLDKSISSNIHQYFKCKIIKNLDNLSYCQTILIKNDNLSTYFNIFKSYIFKYNLYSDINIIDNFYQNIYKQFILIKKLNLEFKEYIKIKKNYSKHIEKLNNQNRKFSLIKLKNIQNIDLLYKKTKDIKNKYLYVQKDIIFQENKNTLTQNTMNKNIHELNIRIDIKKKILEEYKIDIEKLYNNLIKLNDTKGDILPNKDICSICLEEISLGVTTICNHNFHYGCINLYIFNILHDNNNKIDIKCPLCRQYI